MYHLDKNIIQLKLLHLYMSLQYILYLVDVFPYRQLLFLYYDQLFFIQILRQAIMIYLVGWAKFSYVAFHFHRFPLSKFQLHNIQESFRAGAILHLQFYLLRISFRVNKAPTKFFMFIASCRIVVKRWEGKGYGSLSQLFKTGEVQFCSLYIYTVEVVTYHQIVVQKEIRYTYLLKNYNKMQY